MAMIRLITHKLKLARTIQKIVSTNHQNDFFEWVFVVNLRLFVGILTKKLVPKCTNDMLIQSYEVNFGLESMYEALLLDTVL